MLKKELLKNVNRLGFPLMEPEEEVEGDEFEEGAAGEGDGEGDEQAAEDSADDD